MWFLSPLWLVGLVPWGGITLWLLWGRFERAQVPYLELWRGAMEERPARPGLRKPPLALLFAIAALLLAILAAARPAFWGNGSGAAPLRVILDCGMTMSASSRGLPRFRSAVGLLADELARRTPRIPIQLLAVPGDAEKLTDAGDLTQAVGGIATSQLKTSAALNRAVVRSLRSGDDAIFVVSDQAVQSTDPRIVRIVPQGGIEDVGIALIAARELPAPQVMVRVLNQSSQTTSTLDVISAEQRISQKIQLPPRGGSHDYFFAPRELGETIEAALTGADDFPGDDRAWLVRAARWPAVESRTSLDPSIQRMIDVYAKRRPPTDGAPVVQIVGSAADLADTQRGIVIARSFAEAPAKVGSLEVTDQAITRGVNWGALPLVPATTDPPDGWEPLVRSGGRTVLAAQTDPVRKVWIGFATDQWAAEPQFVIFWSNIFDWIGQAGRQFSSVPLDERSEEWRPLSSREGFPGVYQRDDGIRRAFNLLASPLPPAEASASDWRERLIAAAGQRGGRIVAGPVAIAALLCLLGAIGVWRK